jgi:hypothetical protein
MHLPSFNVFDEHFERLEAIFQRLEDNVLKLKPSKYRFFQPKIKYIGHVVSSVGVGTDPDKLEKPAHTPSL